MALTAAFDLKIRQYNAINAFCNAKINNEVYYTCPEGFEQARKVIKLHKALYGLHTSPKLYHDELSRSLIEFGFKPAPSMNCLFMSDEIIVFFFVDDIVSLAAPEHIKLIVEFKRNLTGKYDIQSLGEVR